MGGGATEHPGRRVVLVLVDRLVEVDLVEVAEQSQPVQRDAAVAASLSQVLAEGGVHHQRSCQVIRDQPDVSSPTTLPRSRRRVTGTAVRQARQGVDDRICASGPGSSRRSRTRMVAETRRAGAGHVLAAAGPHHRAPAGLDTQGAQRGGEDLGCRLAPADLAGEVTLSSRPVRPRWASCPRRLRGRYGAFEQRPSRRPRRRSSLSVSAVAGGARPPPTRPASQTATRRAARRRVAGRARVGAALLGHGVDLGQGTARLVADHRVLDPVVDLGEQRRGGRTGPTRQPGAGRRSPRGPGAGPPWAG